MSCEMSQIGSHTHIEFPKKLNVCCSQQYRHFNLNPLLIHIETCHISDFPLFIHLSNIIFNNRRTFLCKTVNRLVSYHLKCSVETIITKTDPAATLVWTV